MSMDSLCLILALVVKSYIVIFSFSVKFNDGRNSDDLVCLDDCAEEE